MAILGRANWWLPGWLDKVPPHVAVESEEDIEAGASEIEWRHAVHPDLPIQK